MDYIVGVGNKFLFEFKDVKRVDFNEDNDSVVLYDTSENIIFITNKIDLDFIVQNKLSEKELEIILKVYSKKENETETEDDNLITL